MPARLALAVRNTALATRDSGVWRVSLGLSALAWLALTAASPATAPLLCLSSGNPQAVAAALRYNLVATLLPGLAHWGTMTVAMMAPLLAQPLADLTARSLRRRRGRVIAGFVAGYGAVWLLTGLLVLTLLALLAVLGRDLPPAGLLAGAAVWQALPWRAGAMRRCHQPLALPQRGRAADRACLTAGLAHGWACAVLCLPLMLAAMAVSSGGAASLLAAGLAALFLFYERGHARVFRMWPSACLAGLAFAVALT